MCYNTTSTVAYNVTTDDEIYITAILTIPETQHYTTAIVIEYSDGQMFTSDTIKTSIMKVTKYNPRRVSNLAACVQSAMNFMFDS